MNPFGWSGDVKDAKFSICGRLTDQSMHQQKATENDYILANTTDQSVAEKSSACMSGMSRVETNNIGRESDSRDNQGRVAEIRILPGMFICVEYKCLKKQKSTNVSQKNKAKYMG